MQREADEGMAEKTEEEEVGVDFFETAGLLRWWPFSPSTYCHVCQMWIAIQLRYWPDIAVLEAVEKLGVWPVEAIWGRVVSRRVFFFMGCCFPR